MVIDTPSPLVATMPAGFSICFSFGRLVVGDIQATNYGSYGNMTKRLWTFRGAPRNLQGSERFHDKGNGECSGHFEQVHGDGIFVSLIGVRPFSVGFWNPMYNAPFGGWMRFQTELEEASICRKTNSTIEKKGLFGSKIVPFTHTDNSLLQLHTEIMTVCDELAFFRIAWAAYEQRWRDTNGNGGRLQ